MAGLALAGCASNSSTVHAASGTTTTASTTNSTTVTIPGSDATLSTAPRGPKTTTPATGTSTTATSNGIVVVQLTAASQDPASVTVGQKVELTLSSPGMQWTDLLVAPTGLLQPDPAPTPPVNGLLAIWTATAPGTVKVTAGERAVCAPGTLCPQLIRLFQLTIVIS